MLHVYDADHWRRLAQEARARAEKITDADARREMRAIMAQRVGYLWIIGSDVQHTRLGAQAPSIAHWVFYALLRRQTVLALREKSHVTHWADLL